MGLKRAALSGARWTLGSRIGLQLITWPITIIVMRLLEPGDYGLFALALVVAGFITLFSELGLGVALVQAPTVTDAQARMACSLVLLLNSAMALLIIVIAPWVADLYAEDELTLVMQVLTLELLLSAPAAVPLALLERELRFRAVSIGQLAGGLSAAATTLVAALLDAGLWALVAGNLAGSLVRSAMWIGAYGRLVRPGPLQLSTIRPMIKVSGHTLAGRALWYWSGQADQLVLGRLLHAGSLGLYNVASQLAMLPVSKVMEAVNRVAFPILSRLDSAAAEVQATHRRITALLALYGFGVCWGLAAVAPEFVHLVLGEKWRGAALPLATLALVAPLRMLCAFHYTVVTAIGVPEVATRELVFASACIPAAVGAGALIGGLQGAALAWLLAYPAVYLVSTLLTGRAIHLRPRRVAQPLLAPVLAGLAMLAAAWACRVALGAQTAPVWYLTVALPTCALVYLVVLRLLAHAMLLDARSLVLDILRPQRSG
jgi:teichuronic acid exporter